MYGSTHYEHNVPCLAHRAGMQIPGPQVAVAITFRTVEPNICGSSTWNLISVKLPTPRILRRFRGFPERLFTPTIDYIIRFPIQ